MRVLFHNQALNYRGVTNSTVDYAHYNQTVLGNESVLCWRSNLDTTGMLNAGSEPNMIAALSKKFPVVPYQSELELNRIAENFDVVYTQKAGFRVPGDTIRSTKWAIHCVFQYYEPHGDRYAYISKWLSEHMRKSSGKFTPFVPYIVNLPPNLPNLKMIMRAALGIPMNAFVIGRHGGYETFDIEWVNNILPVLCNKYKNLWFLMVNTRERVQHPRIVYMPPLIGGEAKTAFISACDAAIHGRTLGETFGLGIAENLFHNVPVLAWEGGYDQNHLNLVYDELLYSEKTILDKMSDLIENPEKYWKHDYKKIIEPFSPEKVMMKFKEVFLDY
jgi:hypothetical protein